MKADDMDNEMPNPTRRKRNDGSFVAKRKGLELVAKEKGLELTVSQPADRAALQKTNQFVVVTGDKAIPNAIIGSGLAASVPQGMRLAEGMTNRFRQDVPAGRSKVMVVNNVALVRNNLAATLRDDGYEVVEATSAEGALRRLERIRRPVVLISDVNLGEGMSGLELAAEVRELWPVLSILLISGGDEKLLAASAATIAFLPTPMSTDRLLKQVATMFAGVQPTSAGD